MTSDLRLRIEPLQAAARAAGEVQLKVWNVRAGSLRRTGTTTAEKGLPGCGAEVATSTPAGAEVRFSTEARHWGSPHSYWLKAFVIKAFVI